MAVNVTLWCAAGEALLQNGQLKMESYREPLSLCKLRHGGTWIGSMQGWISTTGYCSCAVEEHPLFEFHQDQ